MKVAIRVTKNFGKRAKFLLNKYPSLKNELKELEKVLSEKPQFGQPLGNDSYKIRLSVRSKGKGKSGGVRVITHVDTEIIGIIKEEKNGEITVYLLTIYDKAETESISNKELKELIKKKG